MHWITLHSFLSLNWDEWGSIITILTAISFILRWFINKGKAEWVDPIYKQLKELNSRQSKADIRLEKGDKLFIRHDDQLQDHERRITNLEAHNENDK